MKKINTFSAQFKTIQPHHNDKNNSIPNLPKSNKQKLTKDRYEFMNNISTSGFKQFRALSDSEKRIFFLINGYFKLCNI